MDRWLPRAVLLAWTLCSCGPVASAPTSHEPATSHEPPRIEPTPIEPAPPRGPAQLSGPPRATDVRARSTLPDVTLPLAPGSTRRVLALPVERSDCRLDRVELVVEIESMPDGHVTLAVAGAEARMPLHILTTGHFVHAWDWADLVALHGARGEPVERDVRVGLTLLPAHYCGGSCEHGASPMEPPSLVRGEVRLWCLRDADPTTAPVLHGFGEAEHDEATPGHVGQDVVTRFRFDSHCSVSAARIEVSGPMEWASVPLRVTLPDGRTRRIEQWDPAPEDGGYVATLRRVDGVASEGIWELRAVRGGPDVRIPPVSMTIDCAPGDVDR